MPYSIYRKSIDRTPAYAKAETGTNAKFFILKYGEAIAFALVANFAINI